MSTLTLKSLDTFTRAYLCACFFTNDDDAPGGMDYRDTGRFEIMFAKLAPAAIERAVKDCDDFREQFGHLLARIGTFENNGHDFWFTRCGHGTGFWDRNYPPTLAKALTDAAHAFGNVDLYEGDNGQLYFAAPMSTTTLRKKSIPTVTRSLGGTDERRVKLNDIQIPDCWGLANSFDTDHERETVLECWHLASDLLRSLHEAHAVIARACAYLDNQTHANRIALKNALEKI